MRAIELCRTAALGGHVEQCDACAHRRVAYNSCRNQRIGTGASESQPTHSNQQPVGQTLEIPQAFDRLRQDFHREFSPVEMIRQEVGNHCMLRYVRADDSSGESPDFVVLPKHSPSA